MGIKASWKTSLKRKGGKPSGEVLSTLGNATMVFANDPAWRNVLAWDEFVGDIISLKAPPCTADVAPDKVTVGSWTDLDTSRAATWLQSNDYGTPPSHIVGEALRMIAARTAQHPVRDWLNSLKWDRKKRLDTFLERLCGAAPTPYTRAVSKNFFIGAVARILCPGAKVDSMPILEGEQGIGKSTLIRELASEPWYLETSLEMGTKDSYQLLRRKWIVELGELDALTRTEIARVKQFLSQRVDTYRPSYGRTVMDFSRQCVFIGTVNPHGTGYLKDETGARRFWPVLLTRIDLPAVRREREQLWAEAVFRYRKCERWHIEDPKIIASAKEQAEERRQSHPWEVPVMRWLDQRKPSQKMKGVTTHDVFDGLDYPLERRTRADEMTIAGILRLAGWTEKYRACAEPGRPWRYRHPKAPKLRDVSAPPTEQDGFPSKELRRVLTSKGRQSPPEPRTGVVRKTLKDPKRGVDAR